MPRRRHSIAPRTDIEVLRDQITAINKQVGRLKQPGPSTIQTDDWEKGLEPAQGEIIINHPGIHTPAEPTDPVVYWHDKQWCGVRVRIAVLFIKVYSDKQTSLVEDKAFQFLISRDMDGMSLIECESYVTTVGSGATSVQLRNTVNGDMLTTLLTIDSGELNSKDAGTQPVINPVPAICAHGHHVAIDVDAAGAGAMGLGVYLTFLRING